MSKRTPTPQPSKRVSIRDAVTSSLERARQGKLSSSVPEALGSQANVPEVDGTMAELIAARAPRYRLLRRLGKGGEGHVYEARDVEAGNTLVALKIGRDRLLCGYVHVRQISHHENICPVDFTERWGEDRVVVMPFIGGQTLEDARSSLSRSAALKIFRKICAGVGAAHEAGIVHLDLKPSNVLLDNGNPLLTDFGLSLRVGASPPPGRGTPGWMAPEQESGGSVGPCTDIYSLGRILEALLPRPGLRFGRVIRRATAPAPSRRYQSIDQLLSALRPVPLRYLALVAILGALWFVPLAMAPAGPRATWHTDVWGPDPLPASARSVAVNVDGAEYPSIEASWSPVGCARRVEELIDGIAEYQQWEHGYAFPGSRAICVSLDVLGYCGATRPTAPLCEMGGGVPVRKLSQSVAQQLEVTPGPGRVLGQLEEGSTCMDDYALTVTLAAPRRIVAVRAWFRQGIPRRLGVQVEVTNGKWRSLIETTENEQGIAGELKLPDRVHGSFPVTIDFSPVRARRVRLTTRCETRDPSDSERPGDPVWLYELEILSESTAIERWRSTFGLD